MFTFSPPPLHSEMNVESPNESLITWQLRLILFLRCLKMAIPLTPILIPWYQKVGMSVEEVFWLASVSSFVTVCCEIPSGYIADRIGRGRTLTAAFGLLAVSQLLLFLSQKYSHPVMMVFISALLRPLGTVLFSGTDTAIVHELTRKSNCYESHGTESSHIFTVLITEALFHVIGALLTSSYGMEASAMVSVLPPIIATVLTLFIEEVLPSQEIPTEPKSESKGRSPSVSVCEDSHISDSESDKGEGRRGIRFLCSIAPLALLNALSFMSTTLCPLVWSEVGIDVANFGLITCTSLLSASIGSLYSPWFVSKVSSEYCCSVLALFAAVAYALFSVANLPLAIIANLSLGFTRGLMWPLSTSSVNVLVTDKYRVTALSLFCAMSKVSCMILSPAVGYLITSYGVQTAAAVHSAVGIAICGLSLLNSSINSKIKLN